MTNAAKRLLTDGVSLAVVGDAGEFSFCGKGIAPLVRVLDERPEILNGASVADKIVGRAAALLMAYAKVRDVYAEVMSKGAREVLTKYSVLCAYGTLTENIINRAGTDLCLMEKAVQGIDDPAAARDAVKAKLANINT